MAGIRYAAALAIGVLGGALATMSAPASAQLFLKSPNFTDTPASGTEPGVLLPLPDAKPEELRAAMLWSVRAGLNVAALQCQFEPTLLTLNQYNYMLADHDDELKKAYSTLEGYFKRKNKNAKVAMTALDQYGTRVYLGFSTVRSQLGFCLTASKIGRSALFTPQGKLTELAVNRLKEFRNSLVPAGEQQFTRFVMPVHTAQVITLDPKCWDKKDTLKKKCAG